jgi:quercetin dioxygenase-like cupin family protein
MEIKPKAWGYTKHLFNKNNVEVHDILVQKGGYCSKHYHQSKFNQFIVKRGALKIEISNVYAQYSDVSSVVLRTGQSYTVKPGIVHSFEALEDTEALEIYWVEIDQEDIVRHSQGGLKNAATL